MPFRRNRAFLWAAIALFFAVLGYALFAQYREANDTEIVAVALDPSDPARTRIGALEYRGGIDIPRMGENIGGLSGLRWDSESGRLLAITDDARWLWMTPIEDEGRLVGVSGFEVGDLVGLSGENLTGKEQGDSESLTRNPNGGWFIGFERDHRVWIYDDLAGRPRESALDPLDLLGPMENNGGVEALAVNHKVQLLCAERRAAGGRPNCLRRMFGTGIADFPVNPPDEVARLGAVPTDADTLSDGTVVILFRSYSSSDGNTASIVSYSPTRERRELATLLPPLTLDNFEGLAVREEGGKTFLYIVSDDNFSSSQRTLLMKFEWVGWGGPLSEKLG